MFERIKPLVFGAALVALLFAPAQSFARSLDDILSGGTLKVGVETDLAPLGSYDDKNEVVGFDIDIANKLASMLGVKTEFVPLKGPDRLPFLASGKIDISLGGLTRNPTRAKVVDFTAPLHTESLSVLTLEGKPFKTWQDLNSESVTLVQVRGSTPVDFIKEHLPKAQVLLLNSNADVVRSMAQGRGDAMIEALDFFNDLRASNKANWRVLENPIEVDYDAIGVAKGNSSLKDWLNVALYSLHGGGFVNETWEKWFKGSMTVKIVANPYF
jgi:polar amino acid transport system substrate-binding protein